MAVKYAANVNPATTPQTQSILGKKQVKNSAGGYVFEIPNLKRLERFLILGNEGGTYYASEQKLTVANAQCVLDCYSENPGATINLITHIAQDRRANKQDPAIFALSLILNASKGVHVHGLDKAVSAACGTASLLMQFVQCFYEVGGNKNSEQLKKIVQSWYGHKGDGIPYQMVKYRQRNGWTHQDMLRKFHPKPLTMVQNIAYQWAVGKAQIESMPAASELLPIQAYETLKAIGGDELKSPSRDKLAAQIIYDSKATWEMVPTDLLRSPQVWSALLNHMPYQAMLRNLGRMTSLEMFKPMGVDTQFIVNRLRDEDQIAKSHIHPFKVLLAVNQYQQGHGEKGKLRWTPEPEILAALDDAYVAAHKNIVPSGRRILLALDVSGSMEGSCLMGTSVTARVGAAAVALMTAKTEPVTHVVAFSDGQRSSARFGYMNDARNRNMHILPFKKTWGLGEAIQATSGLGFYGTDCALPMLYALDRKLDVDAFVIITDNETWAGNTHPYVALNQYREKHVKDAKLVVVGMTSTRFSIADPTDPGMLDVVGFDANAPAFISDFIRGTSTPQEIS